MTEFIFEVPPEAPVFHPNEDEFADPLTYISKIRPIAEKAGLCKIVPPSSWHPPFALDIDKLRFVPRIQRLNELEAQTRIQLNFLNQILIFWKMQGNIKWKVPFVDLYSLHRTVQNYGGYKKVCENRLWPEIAEKLKLPSENIPKLQSYYNEVLYPFDLFQTNKQNIKPNNSDINENLPPKCEESINSKSRYLRRFDHKDENEKPKENPPDNNEHNELNEINSSAELRRLKFYGPGPKMAVFNSILPETRKRKPVRQDDDLLQKYICLNCQRGDCDESMLLCSGCDNSYHFFCLMPPLNKVPDGAWYCPSCIEQELTNSMNGFGFYQAQREYTLHAFGEMADTFKYNYFNLPLHTVSSSTVEKEYWRILSSIEEDVTVEYGADLHTMDHGSGFPTNQSLNLDHSDAEYAESKWNLNNLPVLDGSVLNYVKGNISGMKLPWMYVGMCFATFCWHNEDHWTYSINYLHWGEPKTWYGVPGDSAEAFEDCIKSTALELFQTQPDLLHQLVTMLNPNKLMNRNIPVYRTDQKAGEFVITFPRAYHAGFNQGYNFAEAVNFAPPEWIKMGRECINHYSYLQRFCVFSHDELVCSMALEPDKLDLTIAAATYEDMIKMVCTEKTVRKQLWNWGIKKAIYTEFEHIFEEKRQCKICNTLCFLSAVTCDCDTTSIACLRHYDSLCSCKPSKRILLFRHTLDQLTLMLHKLKLRAESFDKWIKEVEDIIIKKEKVTLNKLKSLLLEAENKKFPKSDLLDSLKEIILKSEKCLEIVTQHTISRNKNTSLNLTLEDLKIFLEEIESLSCLSDEANYVKKLIADSSDVIDHVNFLLSQHILENNVVELEKYYRLGVSLCVELPVLKSLKIRLDQVKWLSIIKNNMNNLKKISMDYLEKSIKAGFTLATHETIEAALEELQDLLLQAENWERKAKQCLLSNSLRSLHTMELLLKEANNLKIDLPTKHILEDTFNMVSDWYKLVNDLNSLEYYPHYNTLKMVINKGYNLPLRLKEIKPLEIEIKKAKMWKQHASNIFLPKNSPYNLMQAICPRFYEPPESSCEIEFSGTCVKMPGEIAQAFRLATQQEIIAMKEKQYYNNEKILNNSANASYCICSGSRRDIMIQCSLCRDLFHINCVPVPKNILSQLPNFELVNQSMLRYFCPNCSRTKRPKLTEILSLLIKLKELTVRLDEGEALRCLADRILNWQDIVKQILQEPLLKFRNKKICGPDSSVDLSDIAARYIADLVLEGDLLEATINEKEDVWKLYQYSKHLFERDRLLHDFREELKMESIPLASNRQSETKKTTRKRKKRHSSTQSTQSNKIIIIDDDYDDECAALYCLKPTDETVNWVQCDGRCARWYHLNCLGFTMEQLDSVENYICMQCVQQKSIPK